MKTLTFSVFGPPDVLQYQDVPLPQLKADEVLVQMKTTGVNYADIYRRRGNYHLVGEPPYINGYEGAGVVADANGNIGVKKGDRIGFADVPFANAEFVKMPVSQSYTLTRRHQF